MNRHAGPPDAMIEAAWRASLRERAIARAAPTLTVDQVDAMHARLMADREAFGAPTPRWGEYLADKSQGLALSGAMRAWLYVEECLTMLELTRDAIAGAQIEEGERRGRAARSTNPSQREVSQRVQAITRGVPNAFTQLAIGVQAVPGKAGRPNETALRDIVIQRMVSRHPGGRASANAWEFAADLAYPLWRKTAPSVDDLRHDIRVRQRQYFDRFGSLRSPELRLFSAAVRRVAATGALNVLQHIPGGDQPTDVDT